MKLTTRQIEDLSLLYVITNLFEYVLRLNFDLLNSLAKAKLSSLISAAKWFNKESERKHDEIQNDNLSDDANELYELCRALIAATKHGKEKEFINHVKSFEYGK